MKRLTILFSLILFVGLSLDVLAQAPYGFNYQAVARDNDGKVMANQNLNVRIVVLSGVSASKRVYEESHTVTTNDNGHFNLIVGQGSTSDNFSSIQWSGEPHHLKVEIDPGSGFVVMGTVQLQSVPYALHSKTAETVQNLSVTVGDLANVDTAGVKNGQVLVWNGAKWVAANNHPNVVRFIGGAGVDVKDTVISAKHDDAMWNADKLQGLDVSTTTPKTGEALVWDGSVWKPQVVNNQLNLGTGLKMNGSTLEADNGTALWNANKLNNMGIQTGVPSKNDILQFDGSKWALTQPSTGGGSSVWTKSGNDIWYTAGNVGIGQDNPALKLSVFDSVTHSTNGAYYLSEQYYHGGTGTGARYVTSRNVVYGHGGFLNYAVLNIAAGDIASNGEAIGTFSEASGDGAYNIGALNSVFDGASTFSAGTYSRVKGRSTSNVGGYFTSSRSTSNTNYGIFATADSASTNYAGYFAGDVTYTGTLSGPSDAKLKTNVQAFTSGLDVVMQLAPKTYNYLHEGDAAKLVLPDGKQYGFIAQELEEVLPELVNEQVHPVGYQEKGEPIRYKAVNYMSLIPILTEAIQEQQAYIKSLEERIKKLEEVK